MHKIPHSGPERRRYIRLDSVFPVAFQLLSLDGKEAASSWLQGFTHNVSKGGLCLTVNQLDQKLVKVIHGQQVKLALKIEIPLNQKPVSAQARICWIRPAAGASHKYQIGLSYEHINPLLNQKIMRYARSKTLFAPIALAIILIVGLGFLLNTYINIKLVNGNKALVEQLVKLVQESSVAKQKIKNIAKEKEDVQLAIQALELEIRNAEEEKLNLKKKTENQLARKTGQLNAIINKLSETKVSSQEKLIAIQHKQNAITEKLLRLDEAKRNIEKANFDKMYLWLRNRQVARTGLVTSFDSKSDIINWAFVYEQALTVLAYSDFGDFERARKILDFFSQRAQRQKGLFFHAYSASEGSPVELSVAKGTNALLGIAILQYTHKSQDHKYLALAEKIAQAIANFTGQEDKEKTAPIVSDSAWKAVEQDLDTYAFYNLLYEFTAKPVYKTRSDELFKQLLPFLDQHVWSIAAIGPDKLNAAGIHPERIIEFAEQEYAVKANFQRPEGGSIKIQGFNFRKKQPIVQDEVAFTQDSAKMVLVYKIMGNYYHQKVMTAKSRSYKNKARDYLAGLAKMVMFGTFSAGSEIYLPLATKSRLGSVHPGAAPEGEPLGSLAGTAYALFAYYNYNPLVFRE